MNPHCQCILSIFPPGVHQFYANIATIFTLFESENERQKIEPAQIPLPRAYRTFPDLKTTNDFVFHNWTSEIIPLICFGMQMDGT